jgi:hypothetical protein
MVQAEGDQQAVGDAVDAGAERRVVGEPGAEVAQALADGRPDEAEDDGEDERGERGDDRHEATAAEERQPGRQLDAVVLLPQEGGDDADQDAAQHPGRVGRGEVERVDPLAVHEQALRHLRVRGGVGRRVEEHQVGDAVPDEVTDNGGEGRRAVRLPGEADRHTDGEQQRQRVEERTAGAADDLGDLVERRVVRTAEEVVLAEAQQDGRGGQRRDREHKRTADAGQHGHHTALVRGGRGQARVGGGGTHRCSSREGR